MATEDPSEPEPISRVAIPGIGLDAEVVSAQLVERDGGLTWEIPAFKVGHAEDTASAGEPGNAVLLGHVSSLHAGNVFKDLDRARIGDVVELYAGNQRFEYRVTDVRSVARTDVSPLQPTDTPAATLITCTGVWLPTLRDYTQRLVVRAALVAPASGEAAGG